ncbi:MAG: serine hydrolase domain-containing protein [Bacteroidota bacterium]
MNYLSLLKYYLFFLVYFLFGGLYAQEFVISQPEQVGMSSKRLSVLSQTFQDYIDEGKLPGASILVKRKGEVAYFKTFGNRDREKGQPLGKDAIFRIASQTKALVSVGIMILQEEGKLLIADPVGDYIPEFKETTVAVPLEEGGYEVVKANRPITIRDLLTHTAGIGYGNGTAKDLWKAAGIQGWYFAHREEPILATVKKMASLPFDAQPGEKWVYGYNTDILGALIEVISGEPLDQFLQRRILTPLGMMDTHFYLPPEKADRLAAVYSSTDKGLKRTPDVSAMVGQGAYVDGPRKSFSGGAGFLSTSQDYSKFLQMMLNGGELKGTRILSPKSVELMTVSHLKEMPSSWRLGSGFGLGFSVVEDLGTRGVPGSKGEYGWGGAYHSTYWVDPQEELIVVYFTQVIPASGLDDHQKLRTLVYQAIVE